MLGLYSVSWSGTSSMEEEFSANIRELLNNRDKMMLSKAMEHKQILFTKEEEAMAVALLAEEAGYEVRLNDLCR